jgi:glycosyltransferase involved in cell wall biosynthesis
VCFGLFEDGATPFLVPPGDVKAFAARMRDVPEHEEIARLVGAAGRALALRSVDCRRHGDRIIEFIVGL